MSKAEINYKKLKPHPLGAMFPPSSDEEYSMLVNGIKTRGFDPQHKIVLHEDRILDGNHRYTASKKVRVEPEFRVFNPAKEGDPIDFVIRENLGRRNLTPSQSSALAAELIQKQEEAEAIAEAEFKAAQKTAKADKAKPKKTTTRDKVKKTAKALNISPRQTEKARALQKSDPEGFQEVKAGKRSLNAASKSADAKKSAEQSKTEEYEAASKRIDEVCGDGFALRAASKLTSKDILKLSHLEANEMTRIKPMIESGWSLKLALGYQAKSLTYGHNIRALVDRATVQGGKFSLTIDDWTIDVSKQEAAPIL